MVGVVRSPLGFSIDAQFNACIGAESLRRDRSKGGAVEERSELELAVISGASPRSGRLNGDCDNNFEECSDEFPEFCLGVSPSA